MMTPTCLIWGKNDPVTPPKVAEEFYELLPNATLIWIDKCGHAPMMEHLMNSIIIFLVGYLTIIYKWKLSRLPL